MKQPSAEFWDLGKSLNLCNVDALRNNDWFLPHVRVWCRYLISSESRDTSPIAPPAYCKGLTNGNPCDLQLIDYRIRYPTD